jgi:hypothetical protein
MQVITEEKCQAKKDGSEVQKSRLGASEFRGCESKFINLNGSGEDGN